MNAETLAAFRLRLEDQLSGLENSTREHEFSLDENRTTEDFVGPDRAADLGNLEVDAAIAASEHRLALKIRHALERIEHGTYGLCESCGEAIASARLEAKPSVSLCLACQEQHESAS